MHQTSARRKARHISVITCFLHSCKQSSMELKPNRGGLPEPGSFRSIQQKSMHQSNLVAERCLVCTGRQRRRLQVIVQTVKGACDRYSDTRVKAINTGVALLRPNTRRPHTTNMDSQLLANQCQTLQTNQLMRGTNMVSMMQRSKNYLLINVSRHFDPPFLVF